MSKSKLGIVLLSSTLAVFLVIGGALAKGNPSTPQDGGAYKQLRVYEEVLSRVRSDYVEEPNIKDVTNGALHGLLESLDPFSSYLDPAEYADYQKKKLPNRGDTGMIVAKKFGYVAVIATLPSSPAAKAGISSGDIIEAIDESSTREMSLEKVRNALSGKPGTSVMLSLIRASRADPQKITLKREVVPMPPVVAKQSEPGIGYVRIEAFPKGRAAEVSAKIAQLTAGGAKSLVIDLRNSAEGEMSEAVGVADLFLDHGLITYLQGQKYPRQNFDATAAGKKVNSAVKVVVLVNRGTAGPAEVLAAALQENGRAEMIGEKTYGVGSMQKIIPLDDGSALLLSVAKYYTPGGKAIQDNGLTPGVLVADNRDIPSAASDDDDAAPPAPPEDNTPKEDLILKKAIDILRGTGPVSAKAS